MRQRTWRQAIWAGVLAAAALAIVPSTAEAQITRVSRGETRQAIGFNVGYFALKGLDSRSDQDIIFDNVSGGAFGRRDKGLDRIAVKDFNGVTFGGEWLIGTGDFLEFGLGANYYQRSVPSAYRDFQNDENGSNIEQDFKLRIVPLVASVRFLPIGRDRAIEPYVGAGLGVFNWRYSETGEFIDFDQGGKIFPGRFVTKGNAVGPVVLGGLRAPVGDVFTVGVELRYQKAEGDIDPIGLPAAKIDLGGWSTNFTMHLRF